MAPDTQTHTHKIMAVLVDFALLALGNLVAETSTWFDHNLDYLLFTVFLFAFNPFALIGTASPPWHPSLLAIWLQEL